MKYQEFLNKLYSLQDLKYKEFHSKLIMSNDLIGVRTPELKKISKSIAQSNYKKFFKANNHKLYEETLIHGLVLGYLKIEFNDLKILLNEFLPFINNWAVCDMTASNLKIIKNNRTEAFKLIEVFISNDNYWINRFGYVLLLDYFIDEEYIDKIFKLCENYKDEYYVKMCIAWLISMCYIKFKDKTICFLNNGKLDNWTYNKAIQKIIESNRVSMEDKSILKGMKKK